jgi:hypothetical protein
LVLQDNHNTRVNDVKAALGNARASSTDQCKNKMFFRTHAEMGRIRGDAKIGCIFSLGKGNLPRFQVFSTDEVATESDDESQYFLKDDAVRIGRMAYTITDT